MWTTGATQMIARVTGSTLFANHGLGSIWTWDYCSASTSSKQTSTSSDTTGKNLNLISKMRDLRARGPYALFMKDNYNEISAKYPNQKLGEISRRVAEAWKSLPDEKKQNYQKKSQDQKTTYEEEKKRLSAADLQVIDADEKARRIESRVKKSLQQLPSKRPRSAYALFLTTLDRGEADIKEFMTGAAKRWSQLAAEDKQKFEDLHQEEKQQYVKALVAWAATNEQSRVSRERDPTPKKKVRAASTQTSTPKKQTRAKKATPGRSRSTSTKSTRTKSKE